SGGTISIPGEVISRGGDGGLANGGAVNIAAGGDITIGTFAPAFNLASIASRGSDSAAQGLGGGDGGAVSVLSSGGNIQLDLGVFSRGGESTTVAGSAGGRGAALTLTAPNGNV